MKRFSRVAIAVAILGVGQFVMPGHATAGIASTYLGCRTGYVCIYPQNGPQPTSGSVPIASYATYGPHNLHSMFGFHWIVNNQTGGAIYYRCTGYNGTGIYEVDPVGDGPGYQRTDLTPTNSIVLKPSDNDYPQGQYCHP